MRHQVDSNSFGSSTYAWNHRHTYDYLAARMDIDKATRASIAYHAAKGKATSYALDARRAHAATSRDIGYHERVSRDAAIRKARTEIDKQMAIIIRAKALLKSAQNALKTASQEPADADPGNERAEHACAMQAKAASAHTEARKLQEHAQSLAVPRAVHRRQKERETYLRTHGIDPDSWTITIAKDENGADHAWTYYPDARGTVWRTDDPAYHEHVNDAPPKQD